MNIFHCISGSSLLTELVSSTTPAKKGDVVEYPEFYQVSVDLVELSGIYRRRPDYETFMLFEKRG